MMTSQIQTSIQKVIKLIIGVLFILGFALLISNRIEKKYLLSEEKSTKSLALKKYLLKFQKPQRIEIFGLSDRFKSDISEIKKLKVAQDKNSDFFVTIRLFSDEGDTHAPLVAQVQFIDLKSGNLRKEESINLE